MTRPMVIKNARIIDPGTDRDFLGALLVEKGKITELLEGGAPGIPENAETIDARGKILAPGLIDMRVFTGEPGHEYRETLSSAADAAAAGGVTTFIAMPDTSPAVDDAALVDFIIRRAKATACVNVRPAAALSKSLAGEALTEFGLLKEAGAVCVTDGRKSVASSALMRAALTYAANFDLPVLHHTADRELIGNGVMNESPFATILGLPGIPREAETIPLARDLQLALLTGARYHAAQISTSGACELIAAAKKHTPKISAGIAVANLALNENDVGSYRTFFKLAPPLRSEDDRQAMIAGLNAGTIDTIHSGHDPQDVEVKRQPFADATDGAIGLETLLAAALRLVHDNSCTLTTILRAMTASPARILGLDAGVLRPGAPADLVLIDLDTPWMVEEPKIRSRSNNTCFEGALFTGRAIRTIVGGKTVFDATE